MTPLQIYIRLLSYLKPFWWAALLVVLGFTINAITEVSVAKLIQYIIDAINRHDTSVGVKFPLLVVAMFLFRGIGSFLGNYYVALISRNVVFNMRKQVFEKLLSLPASYYQKHSSGYLSSKLIFDVEQVTFAATDGLKTVVRETLVISGLLGYLFYNNWRLSISLLLIAPLVAFIVKKASKRLRRLSTQIQDSMGNVSHIINETIIGYNVVKSYSGQDLERKRFEEASTRNLKQGLKMVVTSNLNTPLVQLLMASALSVVVWFALRPEILGNISAGEFVAFITAAGLLSKPVRSITEVNEKLQRGIAASESIFKILDEPSEIDAGVSNIKLTGDIVFHQVGLRYSESERGEQIPQADPAERMSDVHSASQSAQALTDFNLHIRAGQTVALVGRSGAGKTSLTNLLMRFENTTTGKILFDGVNINDIPLQTLRRQIASVGQQVVLFDQTIRNNIAYGELQAKTDAQIKAAAIAAYAENFILDLPHGYDTIVGPNGISLSGGQRQRLAIARALLKDAPILILDEATSALDNESEHFIQQALKQAVQGRTTIVIAHRLSTIEQADLIVVMDQGRIIEQGSHIDLLQQNGLYAQLYQRKFED